MRPWIQWDALPLIIVAVTTAQISCRSQINSTIAVSCQVPLDPMDVPTQRLDTPHPLGPSPSTALHPTSDHTTPQPASAEPGLGQASARLPPSSSASQGASGLPPAAASRAPAPAASSFPPEAAIVAPPKDEDDWDMVRELAGAAMEEDGSGQQVAPALPRRKPKLKRPGR